MSHIADLGEDMMMKFTAHRELNPGRLGNNIYTTFTELLQVDKGLISSFLGIDISILQF